MTPAVASCCQLLPAVASCLYCIVPIMSQRWSRGNAQSPATLCTCNFFKDAPSVCDLCGVSCHGLASLPVNTTNTDIVAQEELWMCFCDRAGLSKSLCHAAFYIHHTILEASPPDNTQLNGLVLCCGHSAHAHADMALECDCCYLCS